MPDQMIATSTESSALPDRAETLVQVRAELRDNHPRLTDKQIDLIADERRHADSLRRRRGGK
jgi:hypothetical protein